MNVWAVWMKDGEDHTSLEGIYELQADADKAANEVSWFEPAVIEEMEVR
jgi:hypothetical protein